MILRAASIAILLLTGCSGIQPIPVGDTAPFKAVVAFQWLESSSREPKDPGVPPGAEIPGGGPELGVEQGAANARAAEASRQLTRKWVQDEILTGLEEYQVFSDFRWTSESEMEAAARREKADLIVLIRIGELAVCDESSRRAVLGLGILDTVLWLGTAIGSWWIPDVEFSTRSHVEVSWRRPQPSSKKAPETPGTTRDPSREFKFKERLTTGEYRLSFWDRAKLWRYPWPYLMTIVIPPVLVPIHDRRDVDAALATLAVEDLKRQIARKLLSGNLRSGGAPFLFRLESPLNGQVCKGDSLKLRFRYSLEPGFEDHEATRLRALIVAVKREDQKQYQRLCAITGEQIRALNEKIAKDEPIEVDVHGLGQGMNLIRFVAQTELGGQWITNTVSLIRQ